MVTREQGIFKYFLKVVPTTFKRGYGHTVQSNQFSVTEYDAEQPHGGMQLPAVWFLYDLSPISVEIVESHPSLLHFLTRMCAVIGGGFTVTGTVACYVCSDARCRSRSSFDQPTNDCQWPAPRTRCSCMRTTP